jgi:hypothetical protein
LGLAAKQAEKGMTDIVKIRLKTINPLILFILDLL